MPSSERVLHTCPGCKYSIKVPSQHYGKKVQCPKCKRIVDTGHEEKGVTDPLSAVPPPVRSKARVKVVDVEPVPDLDDRELDDFHLPDPVIYVPTSEPEPWYYAYASFYAKFVMIGWVLLTLAGLVIFGFVVFASIGAMTHAAGGTTDAQTVGSAMAMLVTAVYAFFGLLLILAIVFGTALVLILVDMGRQLRAMRIKMGA